MREWRKTKAGRESSEMSQDQQKIRDKARRALTRLYWKEFNQIYREMLVEAGLPIPDTAWSTAPPE
jgi:hypothetical protein